MSETTRVRSWRKVLAAILDFLTVFFVVGFGIASVTGEMTDGGFSLKGLSALLLFAILIAYFWLLPKAGGTLWQRLLRTRR